MPILDVADDLLKIRTAKRRQGTCQQIVSLSNLYRVCVFAVLLTRHTLNGEDAFPTLASSAGNGSELCYVANLRNGFAFKYVRHETKATNTRLWLCGDGEAGYVDIPSEQIENFEETQVSAEPASASAKPPTVHSVPPTEHSFGGLINNIASKYQIDPDFVYSVVKAESGLNPAAISPKGARGLMQLMPDTAASLGVRNSFDPAANVEGGTKYLRTLLDLYRGDPAKALAAYNAGKS